MGLSTPTRWPGQDRDASEPGEAPVDPHAGPRRLPRETAVLEHLSRTGKRFGGFVFPANGDIREKARPSSRKRDIAGDLEVAESVLQRCWIRELATTPAGAFPGNAQMRADPAEIAALRIEVARLLAERGLLRKAAAFSRQRRYEVRPRRHAPPHLAGQGAVRGS